jgi:hypothetical protein
MLIPPRISGMSFARSGLIMPNKNRTAVRMSAL